MKVIKSLETVFFVHVVIVSYFQYLKKKSNSWTCQTRRKYSVWSKCVHLTLQQAVNVSQDNFK